MATNLWTDVDHARRYLGQADTIPHRTEGEATLLDFLPERVERFVDLGCGDGRLTALILSARPEARAVALDFSPPMLAAARDRFADDDRVTVIDHDLERALPEFAAVQDGLAEDDAMTVTGGGPGDGLAQSGSVDLVVSSFAIHHVADSRKRSIGTEVFAWLRPGGAFLNLEHVASPTLALHDSFLEELGTDPADDDPSNQLAPVEDQLTWLRDAGFDEVDCHWKWRELALLAGVRPL